MIEYHDPYLKPFLDKLRIAYQKQEENVEQRIAHSISYNQGYRIEESLSYEVGLAYQELRVNFSDAKANYLDFCRFSGCIDFNLNPFHLASRPLFKGWDFNTDWIIENSLSYQQIQYWLGESDD